MIARKTKTGKNSNFHCGPRIEKNKAQQSTTTTGGLWDAHFSAGSRVSLGECPQRQHREESGGDAREALALEI